MRFRHELRWHLHPRRCSNRPAAPPRGAVLAPNAYGPRYRLLTFAMALRTSPTNSSRLRQPEQAHPAEQNVPRAKHAQYLRRHRFRWHLHGAAAAVGFCGAGGAVAAALSGLCFGGRARIAAPALRWAAADPDSPDAAGPGPAGAPRTADAEGGGGAAPSNAAAGGWAGEGSRGDPRPEGGVLARVPEATEGGRGSRRRRLRHAARAASSGERQHGSARRGGPRRGGGEMPRPARRRHRVPSAGQARAWHPGPDEAQALDES